MDTIRETRLLAAEGRIDYTYLQRVEVGARSDMLSDPTDIVSAPKGDDPGEIRQALCDLLAAEAVLRPDDASLVWDRARLLTAMGQHREAALEYLRTAAIIGSAEASHDSEPDPHWREACVYHAARGFALSGQELAAVTLAHELSMRGPTSELRSLKQHARPAELGVS